MNFLVIGISLIIVVASVLFKPATSEEPKLTSEESFTPESRPTLEEPSPTPATSREPKPTREESYSFQYPGSKSDDVDKITNWYKEKIKQEGYNATSFVTTKTNGKVLNKLAGAKAGSKVEVVISQSDTSSPVEISVNFE